MGTVARTMHGARAQLMIEGKVVGIFSSVNYGVRYDAQPINVLGRFSASEIVLSGMEPVAISATGFRVVDNGPYELAGVPRLQDLLNNSGELTLSLWDRQSKKHIMTVVGVRPTGYSTSVSARSLQDLTVEFMGLRLSDEHDPNGQDESPGATSYPT